MLAPGTKPLQSIADHVLPPAAGASDSAAIAAAAQKALRAAYEQFGQLIGNVGVKALTERAIQLARREYPWLAPRIAEQREAQFATLAASIESQGPELAHRAAAAVLREFCGLLVTFLGEALTERLLRNAWPAAFARPDQPGHQEHKS